MKGIVVWTERPHIKDLIRDQCVKSNLGPISLAVSNDDCISRLRNSARDLLILDYEVGVENAVRVLENTRASHKIETRPIMLVVKDITPHTAALAHEFGIAHVHDGQISRESIGNALRRILLEDEADAPVRDILVQIARFRQEGNYPQCQDILERLAAKVPDNVRMKAELADIYILQGKWSLALSLLEPFRHAEPPYIRGLHLLSRCYMKNGMFSQASATLRRVTTLNPFNVDRLIELGRSLLNQFQIEDAKKSFQQASKLDPKSRAATHGAGECMLLAGELNEALDLLRATSSDRELASVFNSAAILAMRGGRYPQGMALYNQALAVIDAQERTLHSRLHFNKGIGYQRWSRFEAALECFEDALKSDENYYKAKRNYVFLCKKLNVEARLVQNDLSLSDFQANDGMPVPEYDLADVFASDDADSDGSYRPGENSLSSLLPDSYLDED